MKNKVMVAVAALVLVAGVFSPAYGKTTYLTSFNSTYGTSATVLNTCNLCHPGGNTSQLTSYATSYKNNNRSFPAIETIDSDGDGFTNITEINARTFPGDASSHPAPSDTTPPVVTGFVIPASSSSLTVAITTFTATDATGVTGYLVTETSATPSASAAGWAATATASYTFSSAGAKTLYAWAKDAAGNVSAPLSDTVTITLPDTTPPVVTGFVIPASSSSLTVAITTFTATDASGVTGYLVTETSATPSASAAGWTATAPASYTFSSAGAKTLYAWAKDAAGNVSAPLSDTVTITLLDTTAPEVTVFSLPATSSALTVAITTFTATDASGVTGYLVTETSTTPSASAAGWTATAPASYTFSSAGAKILYAWAKDAAGNVSAPLSDTVTITLLDTTAPEVTVFTLPATSSSLTVAITTFTATDASGVTGYLVTETSATPSASAAGWTATAPASYTFSSAGAKTLYAWAKDAAGNVSAPLSDTVTITLPDATPPEVTGFVLTTVTNSLTVEITAFTAADDTDVTGYLVTESSAAPSAGAPGWSATAPASYTFGSAGAKTLYAWAKDAAGNVSAPLSDTVTITLPDATPPEVTGFVLTTVTNSLTVEITAFTAADDTDVTGYLVTKSSAAPSAGAPGWSATAPASYTFGSAGAKTLYAWAKDAAGNVSAPRSNTVTIELPDTIEPMVRRFSIPQISLSLTVRIRAFTATDNVLVTGYMVTEDSTPPAADATGWNSTPPASYTFSSAGAKTLYAWAKDSSGNVSAAVRKRCFVIRLSGKRNKHSIDDYAEKPDMEDND